MQRNLERRVVVVTGATCGLGASTAECFLHRGARLALVARSVPRLEATAGRLAAHGEAIAWPTDLRDWDAVQQAVDGVVQRWGHIDVLVNLAGTKREGPVESATLEDAMATLQVNYLGALASCRAVLPVMRRQGHGHVINVSSVLGRRATPERGLYAASKAALNALTDALRAELYGSGIHVTLVCPGRLAADDERSGWLAMTHRDAAERIAACVEHRPRELVLTPAARALTTIHALAPGLLDRLLNAWRHRETSQQGRGLARGGEPHV